MPPKTRTFLPGIPAYVVLRNSGGESFRCDEDRQFFLDVLGYACTRYEVQLHAYCLLQDRAHLLLTPEREHAGVEEVLRYVEGRYGARWRELGNGGGVLDGRPQVTLIDADRHLLACYRHIETMPVEVRLCTSPDRYRWSSYGCHAVGVHNSRLSEHYLYLALANESSLRRQRYRALFEDELSQGVRREIRQALVFGEPLGDVRFRRQIKKALARRSSLEFQHPGAKATPNPGVVHH